MTCNDFDSDTFLSAGDAAQQGLDRAALDKLLEEAAQTQTDGLIIVKNNLIVVEQYFGQAPSAIELMSVTKSIASLAIGLLVDDHNIESLDSPVATWFPEWREGPRARVTIRHILTHTSGIHHEMGAFKISRQTDQLAYARSLNVVTEPGSIFSYNNEATQLLAGIVRDAAGMAIDAYLAEKLFSPLGIRSWQWLKDRQHTPITYSGLAMTPRDLARIGLLMLHHGRCNHDIISSRFIVESTTASVSAAPYMGLFWWLRSLHRYRLRTNGYYADGWLGQRLAVYPAWNMVAVRMHKQRAGGGDDENRQTGFLGFLDALEACVVNNE